MTTQDKEFSKTVQGAVREMCDEIFKDSSYAETFEAVDDEFAYPFVMYFSEEGDALQINHLSKQITFLPKSGSGLERIFGDVYEKGKSGIRIIKKSK